MSLNRSQSNIPDRMYGIVEDGPQIPELTTCKLKADHSQECETIIIRITVEQLKVFLCFVKFIFDASTIGK